MNESIKRLQEIGAQKIHEQTHISLRYVEAILYESFEGMQKVQLMGFISILEREYGVDLSELKENANAFFQQQKEQLATAVEPEYKKELLTSKEPFSLDRKYIIYSIVAFFVLLIGVVLINSSTPLKETPSVQTISLENNETNQTTQTLKDQNTTVENSSTQEENLTTMPEETSFAEEATVESLRIIPKKKVWVGWIDLETKKKKQTVTSKPIELDPKRRYLLTFGHGYIDIEVGDRLEEFKKSKAIKFLYEDGQLKEISKSEFKALNQGKLW